MTEPGTRQRLAELDALRGIAAVIVMLFHFTSQAPNVLPQVEVVSHGLSWGFYGVQLFFAISGFVIFMTLERTKCTADFVVARFARLYPAYWAGIIVTTLSIHALGTASLEQPATVIATNLTMLQGFLFVPSVDGVYWSLAVELAFYACMWGLWRIRALRHIETILLGWLSLRLLWWLVPALPFRIAMILLVDHIAFFAIGIAAYRVREGARRWMDQMPVLILGLATTTLVDGSMTAVAYACTLIIFVALAEGKMDFLARQVLLWLGALSYSLYLVHQNIGYTLMATLEDHGVPAWLATVVTIGCVLALAQLIRELVEQPALKLIRSRWKTWRVAKPA